MYSYISHCIIFLKPFKKYFLLSFKYNVQLYFFPMIRPNGLLSLSGNLTLYTYKWEGTKGPSKTFW